MVVGWTWLTIGMEFLGSLGFLDRPSLLIWVALGFGLGVSSSFLPGGVPGFPSDKPAPTDGWSWDEVLAIALVLWACLWMGLPSLVRPVKVVSDGPIYHLYFAARWWKAHRLDLIATPFGESAAPYFPAIGDLWFTWLMIGLGGDSLAKVGQAPFLLMAALASFGMARRLGATRPAAVVATAWFVSSTPLLVFTFEPNVDTIFIAGYLSSAYFFLRHALKDDGWASLVLGSLAAGCALGTKPPGIVFVPPLLLLGMASAIWRGVGDREKTVAPLVVAGLPLTVAGFWYGRNLMLTGNPLYPLHLTAFGHVYLRGWYGREVMQYSQYYVPMGFWRAFLDILLSVIDPRMAPFWLAAVLGLWALGTRPRTSEDRWVWLASALAVLNVALYWFAIPYRTQQRFMLQALGLAAIPLARLVEHNRWVRLVGVGLLAVHVLTPQSWPFGVASPTGPQPEPPWDFTPMIKNVAPGLVPLPCYFSQIASIVTDPQALMGAALLAGFGLLGALPLAWGWVRLVTRPSFARGALAGLISLMVTASGLAIFYPWGSDARQRFYPVFPDYYRGWLAFDTWCGPFGSRVAYAGTDLPYYLMGVGLRNEVQYINVDQNADWLLHDYHREAIGRGWGPATWSDPRPGWDRAHPDYRAWLSNLRSAEIQLLVVTRANPDEGRHNPADRSGFPIERRWADVNPDSFELL
jgi:4-amino-4-deoxy-L-arabinose transferase-like glycosyltransferase